MYGWMFNGCPLWPCPWKETPSMGLGEWSLKGVLLSQPQEQIGPATHHWMSCSRALRLGWEPFQAQLLPIGIEPVNSDSHFTKRGNCQILSSSPIASCLFAPLAGSYKVQAHTQEILRLSSTALHQLPNPPPKLAILLHYKVHYDPTSMICARSALLIIKQMNK